jgi:hypothetical protein
MSEVRKIWGPNETRQTGARTIWTFSGVRANGEFARWHLSFWFDSRRFTTKPLLRHATDNEIDGKLDLMPNVTDAPVMKGRMTDMLRARLQPEHIADATRRALEFQRRQGR